MSQMPLPSCTDIMVLVLQMMPWNMSLPLTCAFNHSELPLGIAPCMVWLTGTTKTLSWQKWLLLWALLFILYSTVPTHRATNAEVWLILDTPLFLLHSIYCQRISVLITYVDRFYLLSTPAETDNLNACCRVLERGPGLFQTKLASACCSNTHKACFLCPTPAKPS